MRDLIKQFLSSKRIDGKSDITIKNYKLQLELYEDFIVQNEFDPVNITKQDLETFKLFLKDYRTKYDKELKNSSINTILSCIRSFYEWMADSGNCKNSPASHIKLLKVGERLPKVLNKKQAKTIILEASNDKSRAILTMFLNCGLRISELADLKIKNISDKSLRVIGKGNKERVVPISPQALDIIQTYLKSRASANGDEPLFTNVGTRKMSISSIQQMVKLELEKNGIYGFSTHKLRHTAATLMLAGNVDIRVIQTVLGHSNLATTEIYTQVHNEQKQKAVDTLGDTLFGK